MFLLELFLLKDFLLYADIAREFPLVKTDNLSSELIDDDTLISIDYFTQFNPDEYL
jgi:hypothetical protein